MKKILLSGLLLIVGAVLEICAQSIILDNKLQFESADALSSPPEGWSFTNCSLEQNGEKWFVKVGNEGSVTTPPLAVPSSLVMTMPDMSAASLKTLA